jgi:hypothetical protein
MGFELTAPKIEKEMGLFKVVNAKSLTAYELALFCKAALAVPAITLSSFDKKLSRF